MDGVVSRPQPSLDHPLLHRRKSAVVVPMKLHLHSSSTTTTSSTSSDDLELLSIKPPTSQSYTSLKDLLPSAAVNSPKPNSASLSQLGSGICIRNRLVKQAAWAYLQPMSSSAVSDGGNFILHRLWPRVAAFFDLVRRSVLRVVGWTLRVIRSSR